VLTDEDCEQMAVISAEAPRLSWAAYEVTPGEFYTVFIDLFPQRSFLIRYPLERIPKGQKITHAEWVLSVQTFSPAGGQRVSVRRLLAEWGPGVNHRDRMLRPKPVPWAVPGARGAADRAAKPSALVRVTTAGEQVVNVTEDVELWYSGAAVNHGWVLTTDDEQGYVRLNSPLWTGPGASKLRITYEPE
jgi:hypothetical protein